MIQTAVKGRMFEISRSRGGLRADWNGKTYWEINVGSKKLEVRLIENGKK
jgi:hypothetical protein